MAQDSTVPLRDWNGSGSTTKGVGATGNQGIDGLLSGVAWNGNITYSAPNSLADYQAGYFSGNGGFDTSGFSAFTAMQMTAFHFALNAQNVASAGFSVSGFTNLGATFISGGSGAGTIRGANLNDANPTAYGFYPSSSVYGGDTFFGNNYAAYKSPQAGEYGWHTMLHEIGHTLGLKHAHETGGNGSVPANRDSLEYTVMTYRTHTGDDTSGYDYETWGAPQTYMMLDIAALQHMYGADFTTNANNTVYKWRPNSGDTLVNGQVGVDAGGNRIFATIWDGGGEDTYDLSSYSTNLRINLNPGEGSLFSSTQQAWLGGVYARSNIFNALLYNGDKRSLIENAIGGTGNDIITGNAANNTLQGRNGNDKLAGSLGNDVLLGGAGKDELNGGAHTDRAQYSDATAGLTADLAKSGNNTGFAAGDTYISIENLFGSRYGDNLRGDGNINTIQGYHGNDVIYGRAGADVLRGDDGDDRLIGGAGADKLVGGDGEDRAEYSDSTVGLTVDFERPWNNTGWAVGDSYDSIENLFGSSHNDNLRGDAAKNRIWGHDGNDRLYGRDGHDRLEGGNGNDWLFGGTGRDTLLGGAGRDTFYFDTALGSSNVDTIADFNVADDTMRLENSIFTALSTTGTLPASWFRSGTAALDGNDRIIYNSATGEIFYDADGNGAGAAVQFAKVTAGLALTYNDFFIV